MTDSSSPQSSSFDPGQAVGQARSLVQTLASRQIERGATVAGDTIAEAAATIRDLGNELQKRGRADVVVSAAERLATSIDRIAEYFHTSNAEKLGMDLQAYGRQQPVPAAAIAVLAGFVTARVIKVSSSTGNRPSTL